MSVICIFGNSHIGALAQAVEGNARFAEAGHDLFFWGATGKKFPQITYQDGIFTSAFPAQAKLISGDRCEALDVRHTDILVFYGCTVNPSYDAKCIAIVLKEAGQISNGLFSALMMEQIEQWWKEKAIRNWMEAVRRDFPSKRILFCPQPFRAKHGNVLGKAKDPVLVKKVQDALLKYCCSWADKNNIEFCWQPPETVIEDLFTDPIYAKGSRKPRTGEPYPENDFVHMSAAYGEIVMRDLLGKLNKA